MHPTPHSTPEPQPDSRHAQSHHPGAKTTPQAQPPAPHAELPIPQTHFVDVPGGQIAYDDTGGTGPLIVCTPGIGDLRQLFRFLRPPLAEAGYRVATMDLRGHGESSTDWPDYSAPALGSDILALIRHLESARADVTRHSTSPATVIAESITTASAVWAAAEAPSEISGLVLCGPAGSGGELSAVQRIIMKAGGELVGRFRWAWLAYWASLFKARKPDDYAQYRNSLAAMLAQPGRMAALHGMIRAIAAGTADQGNARIAEVSCPVLVVMGTKDPDSKNPAAGAASLAADLHGRSVMIEGAGHYPMAEFPGRVAAEILPFLKQVTGA